MKCWFINYNKKGREGGKEKVFDVNSFNYSWLTLFATEEDGGGEFQRKKNFFIILCAYVEHFIII